MCKAGAAYLSIGSLSSGWLSVYQVLMFGVGFGVQGLGVVEC